MLQPKFIIEDGKLILSHVTYHNNLVSDKSKVKGGGGFQYEDKIFTLFGESYEFGRASIEDIRDAIKNKQVFSDEYLLDNISEQFTFKYRTDWGKIIDLQ